MPTNSPEPPSQNRRIRVFVSSTFRDMMGERDELMTHAWPELRRFCRERQVELVEVDLRWGIAEEQSTRKETLKLCLDEIRACRPFFIGLLGKRYGWVPGDDAFTADLREEQPWLKDLHGKSVTELEILHGVLNNPEMARRAFFYFRDPKYVESVPADKKTDFATENAESAEKLKHLKERIRARFVVPPSGGQARFGVPPLAALSLRRSGSGGPHATSPTEPAKAGTTSEPDRVNAELQTPCPHLRENYPDPVKLAALVIEDLKAAIEAQFTIESIPDPLTREARDHEAFAETRRRTYIGRPDYFDRLNEHVRGDGPPLVVEGDSGSGKSALLANWVKEFSDRETREIHEKQNQSGNSSFIPHPSSFVFQHYIGGTPDSAEHWRLMTRFIAEIKRWSNDPEELPKSHDDILKYFPVWLAKARIKAERDGVRCIVALDALNQLEDRDHARLLGWLPSHPFTGALRLVVSTLPGDTLDAVTKRGWKSMRVQPLALDERRRMIADYLQRFGKKLDAPRLERIAAAPAAANPLYLKILLDELRVTGTHERLDERLQDYLAATDIPALLKKVLARYQHDYERDRPGLVSEALGLIWAARRGLTETELLRLLRDKSESGKQKAEMSGMPQLPPAIWNPLRAAMEENLVDRGGILNFAHDFLRTAVAAAFVPDEGKRDELRLQLADDFEQQPVSARSCDELPWLLWQTESFARLRACLLDIDRFLEIRERDEEELRRYWVGLGEERTMGKPYLQSFDQWAADKGDGTRVLSTANALSVFLRIASLFAEAEMLMRRALVLGEKTLGPDHPDVGAVISNIAQLLADTSRLTEAELLMRRALIISEKSFGENHQYTSTALHNLAILLQMTNKWAEVEPLFRRALNIEEQSVGKNHPRVALRLNYLALFLKATNRLAEAEPLMRRALEIHESSYGKEHPDTGIGLHSLSMLLKASGRLNEAEPLLRRALSIHETCFGKSHPYVATMLNDFALLCHAANRVIEAESLMRRSMNIDEQCYGKDDPIVARDLSNLAYILQSSDRLSEAEPLIRRALAIDEKRFGSEHPDVANRLNNLVALLYAGGRLPEAEPLMRRVVEILLRFTVSTGHQHPHLQMVIGNYAALLSQIGRSQPEVQAQLNAIGKPFGIQFGGA